MPELRVLSLSDEAIKYCPSCKETLPYDAFNKSKDRSSGLAPYCRQCVAEKSKVYREANPLKIKEIATKSRDKRKDKNNAWHREHYTANRELQLLRGKTYRENNAEKVKQHDRERYYATHAYQQQRSREYAERNQAGRSAYRRNYHKVNPLKARMYNHTRRARKANVGGTYTKEQWVELCNKFGNHCLCCGVVKPLTVDHVVPLSKGGVNDISNLQPLCSICNKRKGKKTIDYR